MGQSETEHWVINPSRFIQLKCTASSEYVVNERTNWLISQPVQPVHDHEYNYNKYKVQYAGCTLCAPWIRGGTGLQ